MTFQKMIDKNIKTILIIGVSLIIILFSTYFWAESYKTNTVDKEMIKRFQFCESKRGIVEYNWVCNKFGECAKQYLHCDYFNNINPDLGYEARIKYAYSNSNELIMMNITNEHLQ